MILGKGLYDKLPPFLQTAAVNLASRRNYGKKYGGVFQETMRALEHNESKSLDELLADQRDALTRLLQYARDHVPYYRKHGGSPDDLSSWPILDKQTVAAQPESFISDEFDPGSLMELRTSGTTGSPLAVRFPVSYHQTEMAFRWRHKAWAGVPFLSTSAWISGHPVVPPTQDKPPFWRWDRYEKRLLCSSYHLTEDNLNAYLEALHQYQPDFIHGYPSSVYLLSLVGGYRPKAVFTASETLLDFQKESIERGFETSVFNWYGNTEMTCNIVGCAEGNLHLRTDYGHLEIADDGSMICTGLNNPAMPFIRYKVGDTARMRGGACSCGVAFPLVESLEGRVEDYIRTPEGRLVGRLDHAFKDAENVREAQIIQSSSEEITVAVVRGDGYSDEEESVVLAELRRRLGDSIRIRFDYVSTIERTASGKFRFIVSRLPASQRLPQPSSSSP